MAFDARPGRPGVPGGNRGRPADDDARADRKSRIDCVADDAGRVVEIDVHAIGAGFVDRLPEPGRPIVDRGVVAEDIEALRNLLRSTGDPDTPALVC